MNHSSFNATDLGGGENVMIKTVTITLSAAAAYMLLVVGLMIWCRYRRMRHKQHILRDAADRGQPETLPCKQQSFITICIINNRIHSQIVHFQRKRRIQISSLFTVGGKKD